MRFYADCYTKDKRNPLVSPLFGELQGLPPSLIFAGGDEIMLDDARAMHEKLLESGCKSRLIVAPERWHAYVLYMLNENMEDFEAINRFLSQVMAPEQKRQWLRLDNAAKIYPAALRKNWINVFRLSATRTEPVDPEILRTALDVTIQAQILDLLRGIKDKINGSIMLITHDLGVIAEMADYVVVMYAGRIIEKGTVREIFHTPKHPYTVGLMRSKPSVNKAVDRLYSIPGQVPNPINMPNHCYFKNRCEKCTEKCGGEYPPMLQFSPTHFAACYLYEEDRDAVYFDALTGKKSE